MNEQVGWMKESMNMREQECSVKAEWKNEWRNRRISVWDIKWVNKS